MKNLKRIGLIGLAGILALSMIACAPKAAETTQEATTVASETEAVPALEGEVLIDGSSTVFPLAEAVAEEFGKENTDVRVTVGVSGTGGGFKKFIAGETDISNASRPIKDKEAEDAKANNIEFIELKVTFDGLTVVINKENDWAKNLTVEQLTQIWNPESTVKLWSDLDPAWPQEPIKLYAPGVDSGTFDYFTETINGESGAIRQDFTASEDDNVLVQGVAGDKYAMAFFGYSYYEENADTLQAVAIDNGNGPVLPDFETIKSGTYAPLSRPLFIYVNKASLAKPQVKAYVEYFLTIGGELSPEVGFISLPQEDYDAGLEAIK